MTLLLPFPTVVSLGVIKTPLEVALRAVTIICYVKSNVEVMKERGKEGKGSVCFCQAAYR